MIITGIHAEAIQRARMLAQGIAPLTLGKWVSERSLSYEARSSMGQGIRWLEPSWVVLPTLAGTGEVMWAPLPLQFGGGKGRRPGG